MRADSPLRGAVPWSLGSTWRRLVGWDGARNQCRHDDAKARHLKLIVLTLQFLFRHAANCPETDLKAETVCLCTCTRRISDADAIADRVVFVPFVTQSYRLLQRLRKSFSCFDACFRAMGSGTTTRGAVVCATIRASIGAEVRGAEARLSISSFATGVVGD